MRIDADAHTGGGGEFERRVASTADPADAGQVKQRVAADAAAQRHLEARLLADLRQRAKLGIVGEGPAVGGFVGRCGRGGQAGQAGGRAVILADGGRPSKNPSAIISAGAVDRPALEASKQAVAF